MTPRPPSELSAALRQLGEPMKARDVETAALLASSVEVFPGPIAREAADLIDRLTRELSEARLALIALEVDKAAAEKMAIETGRELAEARKALKKGEGERDVATELRKKYEASAVEEYKRRKALEYEIFQVRNQAEDSLRVFATAIEVLRTQVETAKGLLVQAMGWSGLSKIARADINQAVVICTEALAVPLPAISALPQSETPARKRSGDAPVES